MNGVGRAENVRPVSFQGFLMITITLYRLLLNSTANTDSNFMREDKAVGKPADNRAVKNSPAHSILSAVKGPKPFPDCCKQGARAANRGVAHIGPFCGSRLVLSITESTL